MTLTHFAWVLTFCMVFGRGGTFADMYEASALKAANDEELDGMLKQNSSVNPATLKELSVKRATVTPFWWALWIMFRFRTAKNYKNGAFLGPRVGDKMIFSLLIFTYAPFGWIVTFPGAEAFKMCVAIVILRKCVESRLRLH